MSPTLQGTLTHLDIDIELINLLTRDLNMATQEINMPSWMRRTDAPPATETPEGTASTETYTFTDPLTVSYDNETEKTSLFEEVIADVDSSSGIPAWVRDGEESFVDNELDETLQEYACLTGSLHEGLRRGFGVVSRQVVNKIQGGFVPFFKNYLTKVNISKPLGSANIARYGPPYLEIEALYTCFWEEYQHGSYVTEITQFLYLLAEQFGFETRPECMCLSSNPELHAQVLDTIGSVSPHIVSRFKDLHPGLKRHVTQLMENQRVTSRSGLGPRFARDLMESPI